MLEQQLVPYVNAAFSGIWIVTSEPDEAMREITKIGKEQKWRVAQWDVANGVTVPGSTSSQTTEADVIAAIRSVAALAPTTAETDCTAAVLVLHNFHRFLGNIDVVQATFNQLVAGKQQRAFIVVLAPVVNIPIELEKVFVVMEHNLPDREQLAKIADEMAAAAGDSVGTAVLDAASGLTRCEAEGAFALSLAKHGRIHPDEVWELKAQALKKNNLLTLHRGKETFADLGGLESLKNFCKRSLAPKADAKLKARGVMLLGVPGTGKSAFAKALGNETGRPTLLLDLGAMYGSLVGQTEQNVRQALKIADAMSPSILFVDEIEKALSGVGGQGDSGVSTRLFGTMLTWLSDHTSDVFFIATCNDISKLPPEFSRAERFDGVFFLDLPSVAERELIWGMYREQYGRQMEGQKRGADFSDDGWTGAEIKSCCRLSAMLNMPLADAAKNVVPVSTTAGESIQKLRQWASGRCLDANKNGIYTMKPKDGGEPTGRRAFTPKNGIN